MVQNWLVFSGFCFLVGASACSSGSGSTSTAAAGIVASEDGTVEVIVGGRPTFALAATGPVARNFNERVVGVGAIRFERSQENEDPLLVRSVSNQGNGARVEYSNERGTRAATLTAMVIDEERSEFRVELIGEPADSIAVGVRCDELGTFHGFGEQYNATNQRGEAFELLVNEQGDGRDGRPGVSIGDEHTTYFPMPYYVDARGFGALFDTARRVDVDLCNTDEAIAWFEVISDAPVQWTVFHGPRPLDVVRQLGDVVGRPVGPPDWAYKLWLDGQGGWDDVLGEVEAIEEASVPVAAFWVQDWGGIRPNLTSGFGVQYIWDVDDSLYPDFADMVAQFHDDGYKFLAYVNPFIVSPESVKPEDTPARFAPRFDAMEADGLLVKNAMGETYVDFVAPNNPQANGHPDFSDPGTLDFIRASLKRIVDDYDVDGWMADFGEWIPVDSVHGDGSDAIERRNTFPVDWHRASREALEAARPDGNWVSFGRSGFTGVQRYAQIHWVGDQQTNWSELDGLPTVVPALLNLGLAGQPFVSHDIAGFTFNEEPSTRELFQRWTELGAFTPVMRTHDGANKLQNWSWNRDEETTAHFRKFAFVHCALAGDFLALAAEAEESGAPILRHMMLVFPEDRETWDLSDQFMLGDALLVAPVLEEGATTRSVYFPAGTWYDVWTGQSVVGGTRTTVDAPIGSPAVFSRGADRQDLRNWDMLTYEECR